MSSSIQFVLQLTRVVNSIVVPGSIPSKLVQLASASDLMYLATQVVGFASEEALAVGDVTDEAMCVLTNEDDTNYVEVGYGSFTAFLKVPPGEVCVLPRVSSLAAVMLRADTAAVNVTVALFKIA